LRIGIVAQAVGRVAQVGMPPLGKAPALLRNLRGALERLLEAHGAEARQERVVPGDGAGHGGGVDAVAGDAAAAAPPAVRRAATAAAPAVLRAAAAAPPTLLGRQLREELGRPARGRPAAGVEGVQFLVLGEVDEREE